jgi:hypothetical protein
LLILEMELFFVSLARCQMQLLAFS